MIKNIIHSIAVLVLGVLLVSCAEREEVRSDVNEMSAAADRYLKKIKPTRSVRPSLVVDDKPWFGERAIPFQNGDPLPEHLEQDKALVLTFERPLTIDQVAARIQGATGVRVMVERERLDSDENEDGLSSGGLFLPADGMDVSGGRVVWQGNLSSLLDQVADRFDAQWTYNGKAIRLSQYIVRTFMLHSLAGETTITGGVSASGTGDSGSLPEQDVDVTSRLVVWDEVKEAVETIVGERARTSFSPATGTITISGSPSAVAEVENYLRIQNDLRLRRVVIEVKVLSVTLDQGNQMNFDLDVIINDFFDGQPFVFAGNSTGATSRDIIGGIVRQVPSGLDTDLGTVNSTQLVIDALDAFAQDASVEHSGTLVTLSDQPAPLQVANKRAYVARVTGSSSDSTSSTSLEPGILDIGLTMNVLPRVIEDDRVMLRIAMGITDLVGDIQSFESGDSIIQLPEIETTGFLQNTVLRSGETLVLAGFERRSASDTSVGTGAAWNFLMGGGQNFSKGREIRVLLITANVLPNDPIEIVTSN